jgi:opacity protein-like surface antigen
MRCHFSILAGGVLFLAPALANAQEQAETQSGDCPPGGWFCEETPPTETEPGVTEEPPAEVAETPPQTTKQTPQPVIIVGRDEPPPQVRKRPYRRKWGFNMRLQGVMMGDNDQRSEESGMGGLGFSFRYRPIRHFAFDVGLDFFGGKDWQGNDRSETALMMNGLIYFNPKDAVQVYTLAGIGFSGARVRPSEATQIQDGTQVVPGGEEEERNYSYFGGQLGIGLEFRVSHKISLNLDVVGFIRGRTDEKARYQPEFVDPETGRTTNTSGGGLFRGGITFYW